MISFPMNMEKVTWKEYIVSDIPSFQNLVSIFPQSTILEYSLNIFILDNYLQKIFNIYQDFQVILNN